jgi:hypothetical protein
VRSGRARTSTRATAITTVSDLLSHVGSYTGVRDRVNSAAIDHIELNRAIPNGSAVAFYVAGVAADLEGIDGRSLLQVTPQGFMVEESDGVGVVWPMAHEHDESSNLDDHLPPPGRGRLRDRYRPASCLLVVASKLGVRLGS